MVTYVCNASCEHVHAYATFTVCIIVHSYALYTNEENGLLTKSRAQIFFTQDKKNKWSIISLPRSARNLISSQMKIWANLAEQWSGLRTEHSMRAPKKIVFTRGKTLFWDNLNEQGVEELNQQIVTGRCYAEVRATNFARHEKSSVPQTTGTMYARRRRTRLIR